MTEEESLKIEAACIRLQQRYGTLADRQDPKFAELFVKDATITLPEYPPFVGLSAIMAGQKQWKDSSIFMRHICTNFTIDVKSGSHATGICYLMVLSSDTAPKEPLPQSRAPSFGEFHDQFVTEGATWYFKSRTLHRYFRGLAPPG